MMIVAKKWDGAARDPLGALVSATLFLSGAAVSPLWPGPSSPSLHPSPRLFHASPHASAVAPSLNAKTRDWASSHSLWLFARYLRVESCRVVAHEACCVGECFDIHTKCRQCSRLHCVIRTLVCRPCREQWFSRALQPAASVMVVPSYRGGCRNPYRLLPGIVCLYISTLFTSCFHPSHSLF